MITAAFESMDVDHWILLTIFVVVCVSVYLDICRKDKK
jgi:hypothetical protein